MDKRRFVWNETPYKAAGCEARRQLAAVGMSCLEPLPSWPFKVLKLPALLLHPFGFITLLLLR